MDKEINEHFIKNYDGNSSKGYILEVDVKYPKNRFNIHRHLPFLAGIKKIKKCGKLICDIHGRENYVALIKALKQAINHGLILKKVHKIIEFNQKAWLEP